MVRKLLVFLVVLLSFTLSGCQLSLDQLSTKHAPSAFSNVIEHHGFDIEFETVDWLCFRFTQKKDQSVEKNTDTTWSCAYFIKGTSSETLEPLYYFATVAHITTNDKLDLYVELFTNDLDLSDFYATFLQHVIQAVETYNIESVEYEEGSFSIEELTAFRKKL